MIYGSNTLLQVPTYLASLHPLVLSLRRDQMLVFLTQAVPWSLSELTVGVIFHPRLTSWNLLRQEVGKENLLSEAYIQPLLRLRAANSDMSLLEPV